MQKNKYTNCKSYQRTCMLVMTVTDESISTAPMPAHVGTSLPDADEMVMSVVAHGQLRQTA